MGLHQAPTRLVATTLLPYEVDLHLLSQPLVHRQQEGSSGAGLHQAHPLYLRPSNAQVEGRPEPVACMAGLLPAKQEHAPVCTGEWALPTGHGRCVWYAAHLLC
jgi:hypothetical protein